MNIKIDATPNYFACEVHYYTDIKASDFKKMLTFAACNILIEK